MRLSEIDYLRIVLYKNFDILTLTHFQGVSKCELV